MRKKILTKEEYTLKKKRYHFGKKIIKIVALILTILVAKSILSAINTWINNTSYELYFFSVFAVYSIFVFLQISIVCFIIKKSKKRRNSSIQTQQKRTN